MVVARPRFVLLGTLVVCLACGGGVQAARDDDSADEVQQLLRRGKRVLEAGGHAEALTVLKEADKLAKGSCQECTLFLAAAHNASGEYDDALKLTRRLIALSPPADLLAVAYNQQALALMAGGKKAERLGEAEEALRHAMELAGKPDPVLRYNLARLMIRTDRREQGLAILRELADSNPDPKLAAYVRLTLSDPSCVDDNCAPEFSLTTLDGEYMSRESLKGKVVLFSFCTTTFPPCLDNLPELRRLAKQMEKDPFVVIAVNYDVDASALKEFAARNSLHYPIFYDRGAEVSKAFQAKKFPTHVVVDHEGRIVGRSYSLTDRQRQGVVVAISTAIRKAKKAQAAAAPAQR